MIQAVLFDLCGVIVKYNDIPITPTEKILEDTFDYKVGDQLYWDYATSQIPKSRAELQNLSLDLIRRHYALRQPDLFAKLPKLKYYVGSNHISLIKDWLDLVDFKKYFDELFISQDMHVMKPDPKFFELILDRINLPAHQVLFLDDRPTNIEGANSVGIKAVLYDGQDLLSQVVLQNL